MLKTNIITKLSEEPVCKILGAGGNKVANSNSNNKSNLKN